MVACGLGQGCSFFTTGGVVTPNRVLQKTENAVLDLKIPFLDGDHLEFI
jgi:hypothetical protein